MKKLATVTTKINIAPNYAITDSLGAILEYSDVENGNTDSNDLF